MGTLRTAFDAALDTLAKRVAQQGARYGMLSEAVESEETRLASRKSPSRWLRSTWMAVSEIVNGASMMHHDEKLD